MSAWSEHVFFNEGPAEALLRALNSNPFDAIASQLEIAAFYAIPAALALAAMAWRGCAGLGRAMLIAALVGFAIEGAVVPAVYEAVPISYLWTSIAWHGPVTVGLGLFLMPRLLARLAPFAMAATALGAGVVWGVWTTWVWEGGVPDLSTEAFAGFAGWTYAGMISGYALLHLAGWPRVQLHTSVISAFALAVVILFALQAIQHPLEAAGLAAILAGLTYALGRWDRRPDAHEPIRWMNLLILALMPLAAIAVYALQVGSGPFLPQDDLIALGFTLGLLTWLGCLIQGCRRGA